MSFRGLSMFRCFLGGRSLNQPLTLLHDIRFHQLVDLSDVSIYGVYFCSSIQNYCCSVQLPYHRSHSDHRRRYARPPAHQRRIAAWQQVEVGEHHHMGDVSVDKDFRVCLCHLIGIYPTVGAYNPGHPRCATANRYSQTKWKCHQKTIKLALRSCLKLTSKETFISLLLR